MKPLIAAVAATLLMTGAARAEVTDKSAAGFQVTEKTTIAAPAAKVYAALLTPGAWWNKDHSWSGSASNLFIDLPAAWLLREAAQGLRAAYEGGVRQRRHHPSPVRRLGPPAVPPAASGHLAYVLKPAGDKTELTLTYNVGGYAKGGLAEKWAAPVDGVLGEAVGRLKKYAETGRPD